MIKTFRCADTEKLHKGQRVKRFEAIEKVARRKLRMLDATTQLSDLKSPGNQLEWLGQDRKGQLSIRINDQWRLCFTWDEGTPGNILRGRFGNLRKPGRSGDAYDVEIVDYH